MNTLEIIGAVIMIAILVFVCIPFTLFTLITMIFTDYWKGL